MPTARASIAALVAAVVVTGCASGTGTTASGTAADADREAPTELRIAVRGEPEEGFDPTLGWGTYGNALFQSTLLARDVDLELVGDLATGWELSDDGLVWTITLRDDVTFTDGTPLTADDVVYTYETAKAAGGAVDLTVLDEAVAVDDTTVELRLHRPYSTFTGRLASLGIVPEHAHDEGYGRAPLGSGPWVLERWDEGQQAIITRNDDHHGELPAFERVVMQFTDEDATLASARAGELHLAYVPVVLADQPVDGMRTVAAPTVDNRGISFAVEEPSGETTADGTPIGNPVTSDVAIRRAVNLAIDRQALVDGILNGFGSPAFSAVDGLPWGDPDAAFEDGDVEGARQLLADAGWADTDGDGVVERDGVRAEFTLAYRSTDTDRQGLAIAVADQLTAVGIEVTPLGLEGSESFAYAPHESVLFGWGSHDPSELYQLHSSSYIDSGSLFNLNRYRDAYVDEQLEAGMRATDLDEANARFRAAAIGPDGTGFAGTQQAPWAWLVNVDHTYLVDDCLDLGKLQIEPHGHGYPITEGLSRWRWTC